MPWIIALAFVFVLPGAVHAQSPADANADDVGTCMQEVRLSDHGFILDGGVSSVHPWTTDDLMKAHQWCQNYIAEQTRALGADVMACLRFQRVMPFGERNRAWTKERRDSAVAYCQKSIGEQNAKAYAAGMADLKRRREEQQSRDIEIMGLTVLGLVVLGLIIVYRARLVRGLRRLFIGSIVLGMRGRRASQRFIDKAVKEAEDRLE